MPGRGINVLQNRRRVSVRVSALRGGDTLTNRYDRGMSMATDPGPFDLSKTPLIMAPDGAATAKPFSPCFFAARTPKVRGPQ